MNDKCNLSPEQQKGFGVNCPAAYPGNLTNIESDWNDISAAVAYIRNLRHVQKLNLVGWSQGGPRSGGWTANHPDQVAKLILLAPPMIDDQIRAPPLPVPGAVSTPKAMTNSSPTGTARRPAPASTKTAAASVWSEMLKSDPVGATWTPAVRRAPIASSGWGWTTDKVKATTTPVLMVSGVNDKQVNPDRVRDLPRGPGQQTERFSSTWAAPPTTPCGRRTTCCCSRPRWNGWKKARSTVRRPAC